MMDARTQLEFFMARAKRLEDERDKLRSELAYEQSTTLMLKDENAKLHAELTDLRLGSCPSCGIKVENERLRELCTEAQEDRERMFRACVEKNQTILRLSDENAKLRLAERVEQ